MHIHRNVGIKSSTDRANPAVAVVADADAPDAPEVRPPISPRSSNARYDKILMLHKYNTY